MHEVNHINTNSFTCTGVISIMPHSSLSLSPLTENYCALRSHEMEKEKKRGGGGGVCF